MSAQVVRLGASVAERFARLMTAGVRPECREEAMAENMHFAERLVMGGFSRDDLQNLIDRKRENLIRELAEINRL